MCAMVVDTRSWCKKRATLSHATFYHIAKVGLIVGQCETTLSHSLGGKKRLCISYEAATGPSWTNSRTKASRKWCQERPSRRRVVCGIEGCECAYDGEYRLHSRRMRLMHSGKKAKVANDSFGVGGRFRSWVKVPGENQHVHCEQECEYP